MGTSCVKEKIELRGSGEDHEVQKPLNFRDRLKFRLQIHNDLVCEGLAEFLGTFVLIVSTHGLTLVSLTARHF